MIAGGLTARYDSLFGGVWRWRGLAALTRRCSLTLQWMPSHRGVIGNEAADGGRLSQHRVPVAHSAALAAERRDVRRRWVNGSQPEWHRRAAGPRPLLSDISGASSALSRVDVVPGRRCPAHFNLRQQCFDSDSDNPFSRPANVAFYCRRADRLRPRVWGFQPLCHPKKDYKTLVTFLPKIG